MAATASNTQLPGTALTIMCSLGPDWHHDKLLSVLWHTWFAASAQPILLRMGPQSLKVQLTLFWFGVAPFPLVLGSTFAACSTGMLQLLTKWHNTVSQVLRESLLSHTRTTALFSTSIEMSTTLNNETLWPERWFKIRNVTSLWHCPRTAGLSACHRDNLPDNLIIIRLRNSSRFIVAIRGTWSPFCINIFCSIVYGNK
jgi:hypothetical protein